jgi:hypothetical protein
MNQRIFRNALLLLFLGSFQTVYSQEENMTRPPVIPLREALDKKMVDITIMGAYDAALFYEVIDRDGLHYGKCMTFIISSTTDSTVMLELECGTELIPDDSLFQTMIVTKTVLFPLGPGARYPVKIYAMCGQMHEMPPVVQSFYSVGQLSDSNTVTLARYFEKNYIQNMIGQYALWAYTDSAGPEELITYGADSSSLEMVREILNQASVVTTLNPPTAVVEEKVKPDNSIPVNKYVLFAGGGTGIILISSLCILLFRKSKRKDFV